MKKMINYLKSRYKILILFVFLLFISTYKLPFYINATGGLLDTSSRVKVENSNKVKGKFYMTYVNEIEATIPLWIISLFNNNWDIVKTEDITYGNMTIDEVITYGKITMKETSKDAIVVAYNKANLKVEENNIKTVVVYKDDKAKTNLKIGDQITRINGTKITNFNSLDSFIKDLKVNDKLDIEVINNGKTYKRYANMIKLEDKVKIGIVLLETRDVVTDPLCTMKYESNESGSSGGLMTALTIYNYITKYDLTKGYKISGTGTIDKEGNVKEISGVKYKLAGAVKNNAKVFLVPAGANYKEAIKLKKENNYNIEVVSIKTFDDAIEYLVNMK